MGSNRYRRGTAAKTLPGLVARAAQNEGNELTSHLEAIRARTGGGTSGVDYTQWEEALESICKMVEDCGAHPSGLARMMRCDMLAQQYAGFICPGRGISAAVAMECVNSPLMLAYMHDREILMVHAAQRKAMEWVARWGAQIIIRDIRTSNALSLKRLLQDARPDSQEMKELGLQVTTALARQLAGDDGGSDVSSDGAWTPGGGPGDEWDDGEVPLRGGWPEEGGGETDQLVQDPVLREAGDDGGGEAEEG